MPSASDTSSAARHALLIPEIVHGVLSFLKPDDPEDIDDGADYDDDRVINATEELSRFDADDAAEAAHRAALCAAALVNRLWFAAAMPLLWARPSEEALGSDAVASPARRAYYASLIVKLRVTRRGPLWHALAHADGSHGSAEGGADPVPDQRSANSNVEQRSGVVAGNLRLPRLKILIE